MKQVLNTTITPFSLALILIVSSLFVSRAVPADTIPFKDLVGVWTVSQGGPNHNLSKTQISQLCGMALLIINNDRKHGIYIRLQKEKNILGSMDVK